MALGLGVTTREMITAPHAHSASPCPRGADRKTTHLLYTSRFVHAPNFDAELFGHMHNTGNVRILETRILIPFVVFLIFSVVPTVSLSAGEVIWDGGPNVFFKYADQDDSGFGKNDHPVDLNAAEINTVLKSLTIRGDDSKQAPKPVFTAEQAELLGRYLARGLRKARPDQDIVFAMQKSVGKPFFMSAAEFFVAGRAFYQDNKLNVILGDYDRRRDVAYEAAYDPTSLGITRYNFEHGRRSKSSGSFKKSVDKVVGVDNKQVKGTSRDDWLVIDMTAALGAYDQLARARKSEERARKREELKEILGEDRVPSPGGAPPGTARITWAELEEGLETLNRLRERGLISDREYETKKKEMLDALGPW